MTDNRDEALRALIAEWRSYKPSIYDGEGGTKQDVRQDCADELEAALLTPPADSGCVMVPREWLPIESAPTDADWWLVWSADYQRPIVVTQRMNDGTYWEGDWDRDVRATHWYPLAAHTAKED